MTRDCGQATKLRSYRAGVHKNELTRRRLIFEALNAHYQTCIICQHRDPT